MFFLTRPDMKFMDRPCTNRIVVWANNSRRGRIRCYRALRAARRSKGALHQESAQPPRSTRASKYPDTEILQTQGYHSDGWQEVT